ncbi:hypothetical protein [Diaphorobacter sp.]|uniref:hypothetical protein n=1 Tax=Diaphorobacter sp. TaxID=1934310 RepID=UPI0028A625C4|nr:hypothetical protein [Diaphorobacter sp.]
MGRNHKPQDPRGGHARIYWNLIDSVAWRSLGYASQSLYILLRRKLQSTNNGNISAALGDLKHYGWRSSATLAKALRELQAVGLIAVTRQGGIAYGQKVCNLYRFTDEQVFEQPKLHIKSCGATNEWQKLKTLAEARHALDAEIKNNSGLQKLKRIDSDSEASTDFHDSDSEAVAVSLVQKMKQATKQKSVSSPHEA